MRLSAQNPLKFSIGYPLILSKNLKNCDPPFSELPRLFVTVAQSGRDPGQYNGCSRLRSGRPGAKVLNSCG